MNNGNEKCGKRWKIQDKEEEVAKSKEEAKKLVPQIFYKWIYVFGKKASKKMPTKKLWDYAIRVKKGFVPRKEKVYLLSREEEKRCTSLLKNN